MKYKCDMIRDLMPLCIDDAAAQVSKDIVIDHISECKNCEKYYNELINDISMETADAEEGKGYVVIAKKIRKRKIIRRAVISFIIFVAFELLLNYAVGYRITAESAASLSGKLNASSKVIGNYDWGKWQFYIYDSANSYDVVTVQKHWNGWRAQDNYLVWPKYPSDRGGIINAGSIYYWTDKDNKCGIQIFPMIAEDTNVANIEVTVFQKTKTIDVKTNELMILTFENNKYGLGNDASGHAYDASGKILYKLIQSEETMRYIWEKVDE